MNDMPVACQSRGGDRARRRDTNPIILLFSRGFASGLAFLFCPMDSKDERHRADFRWTSATASDQGAWAAPRIESYRSAFLRRFRLWACFFVLSDGFEGRAVQSGLPVDVRDRERPRRVGRAANRILSFCFSPEVSPPGLLFLISPLNSKNRFSWNRPRGKALCAF